MAATPNEVRLRVRVRRIAFEAWDRLRNLTTASPARFAVLVFAALILLFTALLSLIHI